MTLASPNRRRFLSSGAMALGVLVSPQSGFGVGQLGVDWTIKLEQKLSTFSTGVTRILKESGEIELHCRMSDPVAFGRSHGNLAGLGLRVTARGNTLCFQHEGVVLQLFLLTEAPLPSQATLA